MKPYLKHTIKSGFFEAGRDLHQHLGIRTCGIGNNYVVFYQSG